MLLSLERKEVVALTPDGLIINPRTYTLAVHVHEKHHCLRLEHVGCLDALVDPGGWLSRSVVDIFNSEGASAMCDPLW
jgi:hypothetical protein